MLENIGLGQQNMDQDSSILLGLGSYMIWPAAQAGSIIVNVKVSETLLVSRNPFSVPSKLPWYFVLA